MTYTTETNDRGERVWVDADGFRFRNDPRLVRALQPLRSTNNFARSLLEQVGRGKRLTDRQVAAAERMLAEQARDEEDDGTVIEDDEPEVDLSPIRTIFDKAVASGLKRPTYRAEGLVISRAPDTGANPGALYVKSAEGTYLGKVRGTSYTASRDGDATEALLVIAKDPLAAAVRFGRETGQCACCGRQLTKHESIKRGVGPICAARWGLEDVEWGIDVDAARAEVRATEAAMRS